VSSAVAYLCRRMKGSIALVIIGVDPHKRTHTASVVETGTDKVLATLQIDASLAGYRRLLKWASGSEQRRWAVEKRSGVGPAFGAMVGRARGGCR